MKLRESPNRMSRPKRGRPPSGLAPSKNVLLRLYTEEGKSIREVAEALRISKDMVYRALRSHEIEIRTNVKRSKLKDFSLDKLKSEVEKKGIRGLAKELEIHENTLRNYFKKA